MLDLILITKKLILAFLCGTDKWLYMCKYLSLSLHLQNRFKLYHSCNNWIN